MKRLKRLVSLGLADLHAFFVFLIHCFTVFTLWQEVEAAVVDGNGTETGHIIVTTIGGRNGQPKQVGLEKISNCTRLLLIRIRRFGCFDILANS